MRIYRSVWKIVWFAIALLGVALCMFNLSASGLITLTYLGFGIGALSTIVYPSSNTKQPGAKWSRTATVRASNGAVFLLAFIGIGSLIGGLIWGILFVAAVTSPWSLRQLLGVSGTPEPQPQRALGEMNAAVAGLAVRLSIDQLSDKQLCRAWQATSVTVLQTTDAREREHLSDFRQAILDELERRHPTAVRAWVDSGARASSSPEKFLERYGHGQNSASGEAFG